MSVIIRLQNLPLSARTGDVRKFFGGLRIPDGGVHILGGDKGDAFIAFMSDEDARLAMRKDGGRIKESRIKLFLSSRMEMQHEVEKLTKDNFDQSTYEDAGGDNARSWSHEKRKRSHSPHQYEDWNFERSRQPSDHQRSKSPVKYSTKKLSPIRHRSRSPRRRSRSPKISTKSKSFMPKRRSTSPKTYNFYSSPADNDFPHFSQKNSSSQLLSQSECQAELERRITEEIEKNDLYKKALREEEKNRFLELQQQHLSFKREPEDPYFSDNTNSNVHQFRNIELKHDYILLEGMDPNWSFREVQIVFKGFYAPQNNIKMELDEAGFKTGRAIVKIINRDDFDNILKRSVFSFKGRRIVAKVYPHYMAQYYFPSNSDFRNNNFPQNHDLCYILKGLPFTCKYDDVVAFFHGFEVSDVVIFYGPDGKATGTGFVSFRNWKDFKEAFSQNGKKIGHRYIEMLPSTAREMAQAKKEQYGDNFIPYSQILSEKRLPTFRRPICAILTGLPLNITTKKILNFFSESGLKPDAIHLTLSKKRLSDGRAFVEFSNYLDFDLALKFHGKRLEENIVCVKQILYDEMVKILDSQKAKHYFATSDSAASVSAEPEKVPYLWEPPDERYEKEVYAKDMKLQTQFSFPYNKNAANSFLPNEISRGNFDPWYPQTDSFHPAYTDLSGLDVYDAKAKHISNVMQNPVSYNADLLPMDYHPTKKYEDNIRSSRLSPENEAALLNFLNRDRKPYSSKNKRFRSLERRNPKHSVPRVSKFEPRYDDSASPNPHFTVAQDIEEIGCIVQLSNVDTSVGTRDLIDFLRGFDFAEDTLIRRYTAENLPTPDVRVTFKDKIEAERAIRNLNKHFLHGKAVDMFIV